MATHPSCPSAAGKVDSEAAVFRIILMLVGTDHICRENERWGRKQGSRRKGGRKEVGDEGGRRQEKGKYIINI